MEKNNTIGLIIFGLALAIGIATAGFFIGNTMVNAKIAAKTSTVKGLATREVTSNVANWNVAFSSAASSQEVAYERAESDQKKVLSFLKSSDFSGDEYSRPYVTTSTNTSYNKEGVPVKTTYNVYTTIGVNTSNIQKVVDARYAIGELVKEGINFTSLNPEYLYTELNAIKPEMLQEATKNARLAAQQFAEDAGVEVGGISRASQGSFVIRDAGSEYGNRNKINKEVRVVTTITFFLKD